MLENVAAIQFSSLAVAALGVWVQLRMNKPNVRQD